MQLKTKEIEHAWSEYDGARQAIGRYDEILFKIRSWWIALSAAMIVGYLGLSGGDGQTDAAARIAADEAILAIVLVGIGFWLLDGLNKSLQLVVIYLSRDLERVIIHDQPYYGPSASRRYARKNGRHLRYMIQHLSDESVAPFYVGPILCSAVIIVAAELEQVSWQAIGKFVVADLWILGPLLLVAGLLLMSWLLQFPRGPISWLLSHRRYCKAWWRHPVRQALMSGEYDCEVFIAGYKAEFRSEEYIIFIDHERTWEARTFKAIRDRMCSDEGLAGLVVTVGRRKVDRIGARTLHTKKLKQRIQRELDKSWYLPIAHRTWFRKSWKKLRKVVWRRRFTPTPAPIDPMI